MQRTRKPAWQIKIAKERIDILFALAKKELKKHPKRSRRYVELARKIGLRYNVRLPKELKRTFCKNCNTLLIKGLTSEEKVNKKKKTILIKCKRCNKFIAIH